MNIRNLILMIVGAIICVGGIFSMPVIWIWSNFTLLWLGIGSMFTFCLAGTIIAAYGAIPEFMDEGF